MSNAIVVSISTVGLTIAAITVVAIYAVKFGLKIIKYITK